MWLYLENDVLWSMSASGNLFCLKRCPGNALLKRSAPPTLPPGNALLDPLGVLYQVQVENGTKPWYNIGTRKPNEKTQDG
jgi:hypothetical protein